MLRIWSVVRLKAQYVAQEFSDLRIARCDGQVLQLVEYCRHDLVLVQSTLRPWGSPYSSVDEKSFHRYSLQTLNVSAKTQLRDNVSHDQFQYLETR